jgi:phosphohistidine phosphatase SixA
MFASCFSISSFAIDSYSIYLVRHAEKLNDKKDPSLTACGKMRAEQLASMLSKAPIEKIYSTQYKRTLQTAAPIATFRNISVNSYNPKKLKEFALQLKKNREHALVVGHSNTTPMLVELLAHQKVAPLTELDYQYLYQIQFLDEHSTLTIFQQPLNCTAL